MEKSHGGILEGQEGAQGAPVCSWAWEHQGFVGGNQPAEPLPEQTRGASSLLANLLPSCICFELALTQGGERRSCMNNETGILLSIR